MARLGDSCDFLLCKEASSSNPFFPFVVFALYLDVYFPISRATSKSVSPDEIPSDTLPSTFDGLSVSNLTIKLPLLLCEEVSSFSNLSSSFCDCILFSILILSPFSILASFAASFLAAAFFALSTDAFRFFTIISFNSLLDIIVFFLDFFCLFVAESSETVGSGIVELLVSFDCGSSSEFSKSSILPKLNPMATCFRPRLRRRFLFGLEVVFSSVSVFTSIFGVVLFISGCFEFSLVCSVGNI